MAAAAAAAALFTHLISEQYFSVENRGQAVADNKKKMKHGGSRRRRLSVQTMVVVFVICSAGVGLLMTMTMLILRPLDTPNTSADVFLPVENDVDSSQLLEETETETESESESESESETKTSTVSNPKRCATVEEMGEDFRGSVREESLKVRKLIQRHFDLNGTIATLLATINLKCLHHRNLVELYLLKSQFKRIIELFHNF